MKHDAEIRALEQSRRLDVVVASNQSSSSEAGAKEHYWGQALQYLERKVEVRGCGACIALAAPKSNSSAAPLPRPQVRVGQKVTVLYSVQQDKLRFRHGSCRAGCAVMSADAGADTACVKTKASG